MIPGEYILRPEPIELNAGKSRLRLRIDNHGDRPIQVGSHTHFFEVNRYLRFEPGEGREVDLVPLGGRRIAFGMNALVNGLLDENEEKVHARASDLGFTGDGQ